MTATNFEYLWRDSWSKRVYQLKKELRSPQPKHRPAIPEQGKAYGAERKAKRAVGSAPIPKSPEAKAKRQTFEPKAKTWRQTK